MQGNGSAVLVHDLVAVDLELAVDPDKGLLPEARGNKGQRGKPNQNHP